MQATRLFAGGTFLMYARENAADRMELGGAKRGEGGRPRQFQQNTTSGQLGQQISWKRGASLPGEGETAIGMPRRRRDFRLGSVPILH